MPSFGFHTSAEEVCDTFSAQIKGRTFLITGTSAKGLGAKCATALAKHAPAQLILVSRSKAKVDPVIEEIKSISPDVAVMFVPCELSDQDSVRKAAEDIVTAASIPKVDVVINNAGVMALNEYVVDKQGNEMQLSSNHIGHFLLTNLLMPKVLAAGKGARIINLSSLGHGLSQFHFDDPNFSGGKTYDPFAAYGQSKTANILFSAELARRLQGRGIQSLSVHPGLILTTSLANHFSPEFMGSIEAAAMATALKNNPDAAFEMERDVKDVSQGCSSALVAALAPDMAEHSGSYIADCQVGKPMPYAVNAENAKKLWAYSEEVVGQKFDL